MNKSKKANRINVKNVVYAVLLDDTAEGAAYGEVRPLSPAMQVQITPSLATGVLYGNGAQQENIAKLTGIAMVLDVLVEKDGDEAPYIAVGYQVDETNKSVELIWLLKGRAQPFNSTVQQSSDSINFSTDSININFLPRDYDGSLRYFADSANEDLTQDQISAWFLTGPSFMPMPPSEPPEQGSTQDT